MKDYLLSGTPAEEYAHHTPADDALRSKYLLSLSPLFSHFIKAPEATTSTKKKNSRKRRKTEREEDSELLADEEEMISATTNLSESPSYVNGTLRDYQIQGLNWLISLYEHKLSGILADEMGLGKTLQTISFLGYLREYEHIKGPYLVIVPKSTLNNWQREFAKWTPQVNTVVLQGTKEERSEIIRDQIMECKFDVLITSFEMVIREKSKLNKFKWQYLVIDEAHRIKNEEASLSQVIRTFYSKYRLLITGTPLQNNLHELWSLLNFLLPDVFGQSEKFNEWFQSSEDDDTVNKLHKILSPFLLRRVKAEVEKSLLPKIETNVYVGMTPMQIKWYKNLLAKDIDAVNGQIGKREGQTRLLNIVMQLRKCCNHPYLFEGAEPGPPFTTDEHLVENAGKMIVLDKLLKKLKKEGSRVLIFSQMSRMLDIMEDYCYLRDYEYCRIDGSTDHVDRIEAIDEYNKPNSEKFIFLLTTRAGGLGINLVTADVVILFDSDWNPQADLQAMDRAHRIGQKKQVQVFRFVTDKAIEEKVLERAAKKLRLDQLVIQQGRKKYQDEKKDKKESKEELLNMIQHGAQEVLDSKNEEKQKQSLDDDIDNILARGMEKTKELNSKFSKLGLDDIQNFNGDTQSAYEWNGQNFANQPKIKLGEEFLQQSARRTRKDHQYSVDGYYKEVLSTTMSSGMNQSNNASNANRQQAQTKGLPRPPKNYTIYDFQFFDPRFESLLKKEQLAYKKKIGYQVFNPNGEFDPEDNELGITADEYDGLTPKEQRDLVSTKANHFQSIIDEADEFTEEDLELKNKILEESFGDWNRREFMQFIHSCAKNGRDSYKEISKDVKGKSKLDIERYSKVFWVRYKEVDGWERYIKEIELGERKLERTISQSAILKSKLEGLENPIDDLVIVYPPNNSKRMYSLQEDRFILIKAHEHGLLNKHLLDLIKRDFVMDEAFRYCFYAKSRTSVELGRRLGTLLLAISREYEPEAFKRKRRAGEISEQPEQHQENGHKSIKLE